MTTEEAIKELTGLAEYLDKHVTAMGGESISMAISALKNQQNGGWISVERRLAKKIRQVSVCRREYKKRKGCTANPAR